MRTDTPANVVSWGGAINRPRPQPGGASAAAACGRGRKQETKVAEKWPARKRGTPSEKLGEENVPERRRVCGSAALNAAESEAQVRTE